MPLNLQANKEVRLLTGVIVSGYHKEIELLSHREQWKSNTKVYLEPKILLLRALLRTPIVSS